MGAIINTLKLKCPRCRKGKLFKYKNYLLWTNVLTMYDDCPNCFLHYEIENGFWWGTGYINYFLSACISFITCALWYITLNFNVNDYSVYLWLLLNAIFILIIQPWIMRIGRSIYIHFFVPYDASL